MDGQLPLTDSFFATEEESNINNNNNLVIPMPVDPRLPLAVAQETNQLVCSTPHRPCWRMEDGEMVCGALAPIPTTTPHSTQHLLPLQATTPGTRMWLHQAEMVCGCVVASPPSYEEGSEVVCGGVGWGRTAQSLSHQTSNTTGPSSVVWNNLAAMDTRPHTTHHYVPRLIPRDTTTPNTLLAAGTNVHFSCECHSSEVECWAKRGIPTKAVKDPPPTQELVPGRMP